jgi:hypothetical protein
MQKPITGQEAMTRGFYGIPDQDKLEAMSFAELAALLYSAKEGTPNYSVIEREIKKTISRDQAKINRSNIILGVFIGGVFTIFGTVVGAYLKQCPACQVTAASNEAKDGAFKENPPHSKVTSNNPASSQRAVGLPSSASN